MQTLDFNFTIEETNLILNALGQLPYMQTYQLINKIHVQAQAQIQPGSNIPPLANS